VADKPSAAYRGHYYLDPAFLAAAVLDVLRENQRSEAASFAGIPARSGAWTTVAELRQDLRGRARAAWCKHSGRDFTWWPYSEDGVARLYDGYRRLTPAQLNDLEKEVARAAKKAAAQG
jgi:hypothetical protein